MFGLGIIRIRSLLVGRCFSVFSKIISSSFFLGLFIVVIYKFVRCFLVLCF